MKLILTIFLLFQPDVTNPTWKPVIVDDFLTVQLPDNYQKVDTLGRTVFYADADYSVITLSRIPESSVPQIERITASSAEGLRKFYSGVEVGWLNTGKGTLIESKDILTDSLQARVFRVDYDNEETKINHIVLVRDRIYAGTVWFNTDQLEYVEAEKEQFFNSFQFDIKPIDQLRPARVEDSSGYVLGKFIGKIVWFGFLLGIIILIIIVANRKRR